MKTALCISGQPRSFTKYADRIQQNIIKPNNADVFLHVWDNLDPDLHQNLEQLYRPKACIIENQKSFPKNGVDFTKTLEMGFGGGAENKRIAEHYVFCTYSMWYSIQQAFKLASEYSNYDVIIRARFDLGISQKVITDTKKVLYAESLGNDLINNWMNYGSYDVMLKYCNIFDQIQSLYNNTGIWCNEYWIKHVMDNSDISIQFGYWGLTIENTDVSRLL